MTKMIIAGIAGQMSIQVSQRMVDMIFFGNLGIVALAQRFIVLVRAVLGDTRRRKDSSRGQKVKTIRRIALPPARFIGNSGRIWIDALDNLLHRVSSVSPRAGHTSNG